MFAYHLDILCRPKFISIHKHTSLFVYYICSRLSYAVKLCSLKCIQMITNDNLNGIYFYACILATVMVEACQLEIGKQAGLLRFSTKSRAGSYLSVTRG